MTTYGELFNAAVRERIAAGGEPGEIARLVSLREGRDSFARTEEFRRWLDNDPFDCGRCGAAFWASRITHGEDDHVLCEWCRLTYPAFSTEPVPGWMATWRR